MGGCDCGVCVNEDSADGAAAYVEGRDDVKGEGFVCVLVGCAEEMLFRGFCAGGWCPGGDDLSCGGDKL